MFIFGLSSSPCITFLILFIHSAFVLYSFCSLILHQKMFSLLCIHLLMCPCEFSTNWFVQFSLVILESPVLLVLLDQVSISFESLFHCKYRLIYFFQLYFASCRMFWFCFVFVCLFYSFHSCHTFLFSHLSGVIYCGYIRTQGLIIIYALVPYETWHSFKEGISSAGQTHTHTERK